MEYTLKEPSVLKALGFTDLGIYIAGSKEIINLIENRDSYISIKLKKMDNEGTIVHIFAKTLSQDKPIVLR